MKKEQPLEATAVNGRNWLVNILLHQCHIFDSSLSLFLTIFTIRLINALTLRTYFQADEYWQALEPAHRLIYGYGYLTWEWRLGLRSFLHPLLYSVVYRACDYLNLSYLYVLNLPKVLDALIATVGEFYLVKLMRKITMSEYVSRLTLLLSLLSSFNWYCSTRSFSNTLEMHLTTIALFYFPMRQADHGRPAISLVIAAICCTVRPTNGILWLYFGVKYAFSHPWKERVTAMIIAATAGFTVVTLDMIVNGWYYGSLQIPLLKFFEFNVTKSLSSFYGVSRPDFYFLQAIPVLTLTFLPFFLYGIYSAKGLGDLKMAMLIYLIAFSFIQHKEFRFIYPLMPFLLLFTSYGILGLLKLWSRKVSKMVLALLVLTSCGISFYFSIYHESGVIEITTILRDKVLDDNRRTGETIDIGFLTPCHSTPYQSHFHLDPSLANIWFLTCEPPLHLDSAEGIKHYRDESDQFYDDPSGFLDSNFPKFNSTGQLLPSGKYPHDRWPQYLVIFQHLEPFMKQYLSRSDYVEEERIFNSRFHWDYRRTGDLIIYRRPD
ncbi:DEKNAAC104874 [Brettanomyces naardenensis]|uniref:Mannosyltransferase n=1 Tax=Brettanomyces naardenensis TaxID=13370 RepID=A0A448YSI9_BRENA|nr:DEKNAAC104874 [Brettanomyces naardenensis]